MDSAKGLPCRMFVAKKTQWEIEKVAAIDYVGINWIWKFYVWLQLLSQSGFIDFQHVCTLPHWKWAGGSDTRAIAINVQRWVVPF